MAMTKSGFKKNRQMLRKITPEVVKQFETANADNADLIVDTAKALIPVQSGVSRRLIRSIPGEGTSQIVDFGPISRILEGGTAQRFTKDGKNRGKGPARPFKNPAMNATKNDRKARNRKAVKDAIRIAKS
ncbi:hypothetical protein [Planktotalea sp.]|uniref:hypothetical protein n=1 Tax=Planktotalea sp. TaxID=2029877 RepID=UPI003D6AF1CF